jgi:Domain of unknown function (DUF1772)
MFVKIWQFATLILASLNTGLAFCHVLEMPAKLTLRASEYATVQTIYRYFGPVGALLEPGSVLAAAGLAVLARGRRPAFPLAVAGTACLATALAAWFGFVAPMNAEMRARWSPESMPSDWTRVRDQWEYAHTGRFVLQLVGLGALLLSVLAGARSRTKTSF